MRRSLALLVPLAALAGAAVAPGCNDAKACLANAECPVQSYCVLADGGARGACHRECQATADCRDPALRCSSLGRCVAVEIPGVDAGVDAVTDAAGVEDAADAADAVAEDGADAALLDDAAATD